MPTDDGAIKPIGTSKLDALKDIIADTVIEGKKKLVVFARFIAEVKAIEKLCAELKVGTACIYGETPLAERGKLVDSFQSSDEIQIMLGQIDTLSTGLTLTAADTCVYYSLNYSYGTYYQSLSRIHRIGQTNKCTYIHLISPKTVDEKVLAALLKKEELAADIVDRWRDYLL